jgi:predicted peptidase
MKMVDRALAEFSIDPNRIYVVGFSTGGAGTWNMLNRYPDRFAAGAPINGVKPESDFRASNLVGMPTWAFHSRDDNLVAKDRTRDLIDRILAAAGKTPLAYPLDVDTTTTFEFNENRAALRYTEWPTGGHAIWNRVYADPRFREWLFAQVRQ